MDTSPKDKIGALLAKFGSLAPKQKKQHNEANTANAYIRPMFEALGWDFSDINQVEAEKTIAKGRVDFVFKLDGASRLCLEVKALREDLTDDDRKQAISYAYMKGVTWAVLTNFERLQVFNAERESTDTSDVLFLNMTWHNYLTDFTELWLLSTESIAGGLLDKQAEKYGKLPLRIPIQKRLYEHLRDCRERLTDQIYKMHRDDGITVSAADSLIQQLFNRLLFIRTAEDRNLAGNHPLLAALHRHPGDGKLSLLENVRGIFRDFAVLYDSELFPKKEEDPWEKEIWVDNDLLAFTIKGLYEVPHDFARFQFSVIDADVLGQVYEQYLGYIAQVAKDEARKQQLSLFPVAEKIKITAKRQRRREQGIYYTPMWVTDYIVKQTVGRSLKEREHTGVLNVSILDPACGSGSFLIRAYDELLSYHAKIQGKSVAQLGWTERVGVLTQNIFGVDLDRQAVEITRLSLLLRALAKAETLPSLANNIHCGNSLISGTEEELRNCLGDNFRDYKPFNWHDKFPDIIKQGGFDVVIGNPPYVMELRESKDLFRVLKATQLGQQYYESKMDIFYFFIERAIDLLKPGGYLGFIVQEYWTSRAHASKLRKKIFEETWPLVLIDFKEFQVFKDAPGQHNMVLVLKKAINKEGKTIVMSLKSSEVTEQEVTKALASDVGSQTAFEVRVIDTSRLHDVKTDKVYLTTDAVSDTLAKLAQDSWRLEDEEIQVGADVHQPFLRSRAIPKLATPSWYKPGEGIFVLREAEVQKLKLNSDEQAILRPFHYAKELDRYSYDADVRYHLIYTPKEIARDIECKPGKYPNIRAHLDRYQSVVTSDNKPYGIHRARQPEWFEDKEKVVGVRKTRYPKFVVIPEPWYGDQSVLIIRLTKHKHVSVHFLTAILNSRVGLFWLFQQKRQGNQLQIDKEVLLHFPIPNLDINRPDAEKLHDELVNLAKKIFDLRRKLVGVKAENKDILGEKKNELEGEISKTDAMIDQLVYELYGITTEAEKQVIQASVATKA